MKLIDRYVYAVTEHLPQDIREDVSKELYANIEDMLPENPTESDVREILEKLGNPMKLAEEYSPNKKYLIGPAFYDSYLSVLKLVIGIVIPVFICITALEWTFDPPVKGEISQISVKFFVDMLVALIQGVIQGALWVTIVFVILERSGVNEGKIPFIKKKWSVDDLPTIPASNKGKISRGETIVSMFFTVFFTALLYMQPSLIAMYIKVGNGVTEVIPLFNIERLRYYILIIILFAIIQLCIFIWKFISMRWNIPLAIVNAAYNIALCILMVVMISDKFLLNNNFLSKIGELMQIHSTQIDEIWLRSIWVFAVIFVAITIWDSISAFSKSRK